MNTLFTYGCSVTENLNNLPEWSERVQYAEKYVGYRYESWPEILANKLNYHCDNYAASSAWGKFPFKLGNTNEDIFEALSLTCDKFSKNDIVLVQLTTLARFRYITNMSDFDTILPGHVESYTEQQTLIDMLENKSKKQWVRPLINNLNSFIRLSKEVGFDIWIWSNCDIIQKEIIPTNHPNWLFNENINELLPKWGAHHITDETDGDIIDYHLAQPGQEILASNIYNKIKS